MVIGLKDQNKRPVNFSTGFRHIHRKNKFRMREKAN